MHFSILVAKNVLRRRTRSILTITGVAVAVAAVVALLGTARGFEESLRAVYQSRGIDLMVVRAGSVQRFSSVLDEGLGRRIAGLEDVNEVLPGLADVVSFEEMDLFGVVIQGLPLDRGPLGERSGWKIVAGRRIVRDDRRAVMLGTILAKNLGKKVGERVEPIPGETFEVVGIYESFNVFENGSMAMALGELQALMGRQGEVTHFMVDAAAADRQTLDRLAGQIEAFAPALEAVPTAEYVDAAVEIRMARAMAWLTSAIALVVGTIGMANTMLTAVFERTRELAVLRAIGWRKSRVVRLVLGESLVLSVAGAVAGTLLAVATVQVLSRMPASERMLSGDISPGVILQGFVIALVVGLLGGIGPALRAASLVPTEGLRHE